VMFLQAGPTDCRGSFVGVHYNFRLFPPMRATNNRWRLAGNLSKVPSGLTHRDAVKAERAT
jgi:hypothetical protein